MSSKIDSKVYKKGVIYVPRDMWTDSNYPFKDGVTEVTIEFVDGGLFIKEKL